MPSRSNAYGMANVAPLGYHQLLQGDAMPETSIQTPPGFSDLSKAEQLQYLQSLWDQISEYPDDIPVPESHLQLAEERLRRYREDPSSAVPAFDVMVQRGLKDSDADRTITNEEMHRRMKTWQK